MSYLQRKMFANGGSTMGPATPIGDYQIRDLTTGEILIDLKDRPDFISSPTFNPYKILYDDTLEKGPAVLSILQNFQKEDVPFGIGKEDIGTNIADLGFGAARIAEGPIRGLSKIAGEMTGIGALKDFGGMSLDPTLSKPGIVPGIIPGVDLFKSSYESFVPTDADRARAQINILKGTDALSVGASKLGEKIRPFAEETGKEVADFLDLGYPFGTPDYSIPTDATGKPTQRVQDMQADREQAKERDLASAKDAELDLELKELTEGIFESIKPGQDPRKPISPLDAATKKEIEDYIPGDYIAGLDEPLPKTEDLVTDNDGDPISRKLNEPGFFGSDRFLNFLRNVGGELVETGQMGSGLASGAAKAAEERAARELLAEQEERKYAREMEIAMAKASATSGSDLIMKPKDIRNLNTELKTNISDLEGGVAATGFVDLAIETLQEAIDNEESVGGFFGAMNGLKDKLFALAGVDSSYEDQSAQTKINKLVEVVRQKNLQAILGESGRTISDKDRAIILEVFGNLELTENAEITLGKLIASRQSLAQNNIKLKALIEDDTAFMFSQGVLGQGFGKKLLPDYQRILQIDPLISQSAQILSQFMGGANIAGIPEISL